MSKRITLTDLEARVLKSLFSEALNGYYSDSNIAEMELEERINAEAEKSIIQSVLKKL